jgi:hypothetical protein
MSSVLRLTARWRPRAPGRRRLTLIGHGKKDLRPYGPAPVAWWRDSAVFAAAFLVSQTPVAFLREVAHRDRMRVKVSYESHNVVVPGAFPDGS